MCHSHNSTVIHVKLKPLQNLKWKDTQDVRVLSRLHQTVLVEH